MRSRSRSNESVGFGIASVSLESRDRRASPGGPDRIPRRLPAGSDRRVSGRGCRPARVREAEWRRGRSTNNWVRIDSVHRAVANRIDGNPRSRRASPRRRVRGLVFLVESFPPCLCESPDRGTQVFRVGPDRGRIVGADDHQQIVSGRPVVSMIPKGLSELPLHAVSTDRVANPPPDRQTDSKPGKIIRSRVDQERSRLAPDLRGMDLRELTPTSNPPLGTETSIKGIHRITTPRGRADIHA